MAILNRTNTAPPSVEDSMKSNYVVINSTVVLVPPGGDPTRAYKHFDPACLQYDAPRKNSNGGSSVSFKAILPNNKVTKLYLQTPEMKLPFGVSNFQRDNGSSNLSMQLQFEPTDEDLKTLLRSLDESHVRAAQKNVATWFAKSIDARTIEALYRDTIVPSKDPEKYEPTFRAKINAKTQFYDADQKPCTVESITPGARVVCLLECNTIWFVNRSFAPSFTVVQCKVCDPIEQPNFAGYAIEDMRT